VQLTDRAGLIGQSAVTSRLVDLHAPSVAVLTAGTLARGTNTLTATASDADGSGVDSVRLQYQAPDGAWMDVGVPDTTPPYTAVLDAASLTSGGPLARAVAPDAVGHSAASAPVLVIVPDAEPPATPAQEPATSSPPQTSSTSTGEAPRATASQSTTRPRVRLTITRRAYANRILRLTARTDAAGTLTLRTSTGKPLRRVHLERPGRFTLSVRTTTRKALRLAHSGTRDRAGATVLVRIPMQ
jgi:hypothetical protein